MCSLILAFAEGPEDLLPSGRELLILREGSVKSEVSFDVLCYLLSLGWERPLSWLARVAQIAYL